jgi:hypothetical protein
MSTFLATSLIPFGINLLSALVLVLLIYHAKSGRRDYVFTFLLVSTTIFVLCNTLFHVEMNLAFALGLFAVFGIIRYRTDAIPTREMTYLFVVIALAVLNALAPAASGPNVLWLPNVLVWTLAFVLERVWKVRHIATKLVVYDRVDLLHAGRRAELLADLEQRTGVDIVRIEIGKVDLLRDTAVIRVHFDGDKQPDHFEAVSSSGD